MKNRTKILIHSVIYLFVSLLFLQFQTDELNAQTIEHNSIATAEVFSQTENDLKSVPQYTILKKYGEDDEADDSGVCGEQITWQLINGTLHITGTGKMYDYPSTPPWYKNSYKINSVEVSEGITYIGEAALYECGSLTDVKLPSTLNEIGKGAFVRCYELQQVALPAQLKYIDAYAFQNTGIKEIALPEKLKKIGDNAFSYCDKLQSVQIPSKITKISVGLFYECDALISISLPAKLKTIGESAFYNCSSLRKVSIPKSVKEIGNGAFYGCTSLKSVTLPSGLKDIGMYTFSEGTKAKNLPDDVSQMEDGALCKVAKVKIKVKESYKQAFEVLKMVNKERKSKGLKALKMDKKLLDAAMFRGAETCLYFSHTRPSGFECFSISDLMMGENIAVGQSNASEVMNGWMNSPGHRANILNERWTSIGIGCVEINGIKYWVQCFGPELSFTAKQKSYKDKSKNRTIRVAPEYLSKVSKISVSSSHVGVGGTIDVKVEWYNQFVTISIPASNMEYKSSKKSVCKVVKGKIKGIKAGTAKVKIWFPGYKKGAVTKKITVM